MRTESQMGELRDDAGRSTAMADQQMERMMGRLLQTGVLAAAVTVALGGALYLGGHGHESVAYSSFHPRPLRVNHPLRLIGELRQASPGTELLDIGILLLVATPVLRVVLGLISFARERDWMYVLVSALVLGALLVGMFHGG